MRTIIDPAPATWPELCKRPSIDTKFLERTVANIVADVRQNGDAALRHCSRFFDKVELDEFRVTDAEFSEASVSVPEDLKLAIQAAEKNIEAFHSIRLDDGPAVETMPGVVCRRRTLPIENVGLYIPAGSAPLFSTVLMLAVPAKLAGCNKIVITTPPDADGKAADTILYTAQLCGVTDVYKVGGAQAIAALAFGTETVPKVDKIFGPGNQFVTEAKLQILRSGVAIDMPAGPSEVAVLADTSCVPSFVAADLLAQAEHGPDSQVVLVSTSTSVIEEVNAAIDEQIVDLPRADIARAALSNSVAIQFESIDAGIAFLNSYAAEHVIVATSAAEADAERIVNGGSIFIGNYSCESAGDYASGTNHTLPTGGTARAYSGVSTRDFMKTITYQTLTADGVRGLAPVVEIMAAAEGLDAHRRAMAIRREPIGASDDV
jgi:histidinol dehydrogenase